LKRKYIVWQVVQTDKRYRDIIYITASEKYSL